MAPTIRNVALLGATGNVGAPTLKALLAANKFSVTVLVRPGSTHTFPAEVQVREVDLAQTGAVTEVLRGQDAFINASSIQDPSVHVALVEAARVANVYRLIPADFGMDPDKALGPEFPVFGVKAATLKHLREVTTSSATSGYEGFTWTIVSNGPFLDWNMATGFLGIDVPNRQAEIAGGSENVPTPYTTLESIGKAVASVLLHPAETANRNVRIQSVVKSQTELLALAREALPDDGQKKWEVTHEDLQSKYDWAMAELAKGNFETAVWAYQIRQTSYDARYAGPWEGGNDNELLGIQAMSDEQVKDLIRELAAKVA